MPTYTERALFAYALAVPFVIWYGAASIAAYIAVLGHGEPTSWIVYLLLALYGMLALFAAFRILRPGVRRALETQALLVFGLLVTIAGAVGGAIAFIQESGVYAVLPIWNLVYAFVLAQRYVEGDLSSEHVVEERAGHQELVLYVGATALLFVGFATILNASPALLVGMLVACVPPVGDLVIRLHAFVASN